MGPGCGVFASFGTDTIGSTGWAGSTSLMSVPLSGSSQSTNAAAPRRKSPAAASRDGVNHRIGARICASEEAARQSAVDRDQCPGDVRGGVRGEEADDVRHFARLPETAQRDRFEVLGAGLALEGFRKALGLDLAGRD